MTAQDIAVALWVGVTLGICLIQQYELDQLKKAIHLNTVSVRIIGERVIAATWTEGSDMPMAEPTQTELMQ